MFDNKHHNLLVFPWENALSRREFKGILSRQVRNITHASQKIETFKMYKIFAKLLENACPHIMRKFLCAILVLVWALPCPVRDRSSSPDRDMTSMQKNWLYCIGEIFPNFATKRYAQKTDNSPLQSPMDSPFFIQAGSLGSLGSLVFLTIAWSDNRQLGIVDWRLMYVACLSSPKATA